MLQNRRWALRDYVKGFKFSPVRFTGEVDLYPLSIRVGSCGAGPARPALPLPARGPERP